MTSCMTEAEARLLGKLEPSYELWTKLKAFSFDMKGPYPYSKRLAKENEWPYDYTLSVIEEYRKLLYLLATVGDDLVASPDVEDAWRLHLIYTGSYFRGLCERVLGKRIEHSCDDGSQSPAAMSKRWQKTMDAYRRVFGEPSEMIWFEPDWFGHSPHRRLIHSVKSLVNPAPLVVNANGFERIPAKHQKLWRKIKNFRFDKLGAAYPYSARLADESFEGDRDYAHVVIEEYRRFLFLMGAMGHSVTPSFDVDEAWHLHLDFTGSYWDEMMGKIIGTPYHHSPGNGEDEGEALFQLVYQRTLAEYEEHFGTPPMRVWGVRDTNVDWRTGLEGTGL